MLFHTGLLQAANGLPSSSRAASGRITGEVKDATGLHAQLSGFASWFTLHFQIDSNDRFTMLSGICRDSIVREIYTPLSVGATICLHDAEMEGGELCDWLLQQRVTVL